MSECDEVAANMQPPRFVSFDAALAWVKTQMPDESVTVRDNVAEALWCAQGGAP